MSDSAPGDSIHSHTAPGAPVGDDVSENENVSDGDGADLGGPSSRTPPRRHCRNCATPVELTHCPKCGQNYSAAERLSFRDAAAEAIQFFHYDGVVTRDLWALIAKPGGLTADYVHGRRARHLSPGRLFFLVYVAFFFLMQHFDQAEFEAAKEAIGADRLAAIATARGWSLDALDARLDASLRSAYPMWIFLLIPPMVALVALLHLSARKPMMVHSVYVLHTLAFILIINIPDMATSSENAMFAVWAFLHLVVLPPYLYLSLRRVYGESKRVTVLKTGALWVGLVLIIWPYTDWVVYWAVLTL